MIHRRRCYVLRVFHSISSGIALLLLPAFTVQAGDILRGGAVAPKARDGKGTGAGAGQADAARVQANAKDRLARTTAAVQSARVLQKSAREAAQASTARLRNPKGGVLLPRVRDGLVRNGLEVDPRVPKNLKKPKAGEDPTLWVGAELPTEKKGSGGSRELTVVQTEQQALLNWRTFNVGKKTTLTFDQSKGGSDKSKWVAFNKVNDPKGRPSQILGKLNADGQVYILNQNGIIFGGSSQVNTYALTAAALPINPTLIARGLLNNTDAQFLFSAFITDSFEITAASKVLSQALDDRSTPKLTFTHDQQGEQTLVAGDDYSLTKDRTGRTVITMTEAGNQKLESAKVGTLITAEYLALSGDVVVERGAQIASPTTPAKVGGRVMLAGANVRNSGTISTPDGQTVLAAGLQIGVLPHAGSDPSLRGLDVVVGAVDDPDASRRIRAGTAINDGIIEIERANATITGKSVQQNGIIDSTTSVSLNGRIDLLAVYDYVANPAYNANGATEAHKTLFVPRSTGVVTIGEGSVMRILPEIASDEKITGTEVAIRSQVNARGLAVHFDKGSQLLAPNASVTVQAGKWDYIPSTTEQQPPLSRFVYSAGQIYVDEGAMIDVAGTTAVQVPLEQNILTLEFRGPELADTPLQREGPFRNTTITIDARRTGTFNGREWIGTPLGDATGFLELIERGVGQLTVAGGDVTLQAGESVVLQKGSIIDVSGGWMNNKGGYIKTTKVIQGPRLIDIADATPDMVYDGIYDPTFTETHAKWGITRTFRPALSLDRGHYESDYIQGAAGGKISITAASMALDGKLEGTTVIGPRQLRETRISSSLPKPSKLELAFRSQDPEPKYGEPFMETSLRAPTIVFGDRQLRPAQPFAVSPEGKPLALEGRQSASLVNPFRLLGERRRNVELSPSLLSEGGFGELIVDNSAGDIFVPGDVVIEAPAFGALTLKGRNIDVQGSITAPGGSLTFAAYNVSPYLAAQYKARDASIPVPPIYADPDAGRFTLGPGAVLNTAGLIFDVRNPSPRGLRPIVADGGKVDVTAFTARLAPGSLIDVSGGVLVDRDNTITYGDGGSIALRAGKDPNLGALFLKEEVKGRRRVEDTERLLSGRLRIHGELRGFSGAKGGSLALQAPFIQVGGRATEPGTLLLRPDFFNRGGFTQFDLTGIGGLRYNFLGEKQHLPGVVIAENTVLEPRVTSLIANPHPRNGGTLDVSEIVWPKGERPPVSLAFRSLGLSDDVSNTGLLFRGDLVMKEGARIVTDPLGEVSFSGSTVAILGTVVAPGGKITVSGSKDSINTFEQNVLAQGREQSLTTVYLGTKSRLSTAGTMVLVRDRAGLGRRLGSVLPGGTIEVSGNIVARRGAVLDVSGTSGVLDFSPHLLTPTPSLAISARSGLNAPLASRQFVPVRLDSDGGKIILDGGEQLFTDAALKGHAGGPAAYGGSLEVSSGRFSVSGGFPTDPNLIVSQRGRTLPLDPLPSLFETGEQTLIGQPVVRRDGRNIPALGYFTVTKFEKGGFDSLTLDGVVKFKGPVNIKARDTLKVASGGVMYANDHVKLSAPYVALGMPFRTPSLPAEPKHPFTAPTNPYHFGPTQGPGIITVEADLIDIGTLSLRNIRRANFLADGGDIRGEGTLNIAGHLHFRAGQIYTPTASNFTVVAYDYRPRQGQPVQAGSVTIQRSGTRQIPLSAGGTISIYASSIAQNGVLRAPMGTINLGWDGTGEAPQDLVTGDARTFPVTKRLALGPASITSVSLVDSVTGEGRLIPYGVSIDGNSWIDPTGTDVTLVGLPEKRVNLGAERITTRNGSQIDLRGGGDLYAYRWVEGNLGRQDILASEDRFVIIPGYDANYAPFAPFNDSDAAAVNFSRDPLDSTTRDPGYVNSRLRVGDRITIGPGSEVTPGTYTLLPARYALLPGAYLVTPSSSRIPGPLALPDGSHLVSGYRFNSLNAGRRAPQVYSSFEIASADVFRNRARYDDFTANDFMRESAHAVNAAPQLLPADSGHLVFQGIEKMRLNGLVRGESISRGRGAFVDISSPGTLVIAGPDARPTGNRIVLNAANLSGWGVESLLIGGVRTRTEDGTTVKVNTGTLVVDNEGSPLTGPEIILVANERLRLAGRSEVAQRGSLTLRAENLLLDGDGALLRVSSDIEAAMLRANVPDDAVAEMSIGRRARIAGASVTLDSSFATRLDGRAILDGEAFSLHSGQITMKLGDYSEDILPTKGLVLRGRILRQLEDARSVSLLSYTSLDVYGAGRFGSNRLGSLELQAGQIRGFNDGGTVRFIADTILLDNTSAGRSLAADRNPSGHLSLQAGAIEIGNRSMRVDQFARTSLNAAGAVLLDGKGRLLVAGNLDVNTPAFFATGGTTSFIRATGDLNIQSVDDPVPVAIESGLGASLTLQGRNVTANSDIYLPSGLLTLQATKGSVNVNGRLDVSGTTQRFLDLVKTTDAGQITLTSRRGDVKLGRRSTLVLSAPEIGGNAGRLFLNATRGVVDIKGTLLADGGAEGAGGQFSLDVSRLPSLAKVNDALNAGGFTELRNFRVRTGDVTVDGVSTSRHFRLSADAGSIRVNGTIDASGATGGTISLIAAGSLILANGAVLDASGRTFSNAGKGGAVLLEAGAQIDGVSDPTALLDVRSGSKIDLSVADAKPYSEGLGRFTGTLHLRAPQLADASDVQIAPIEGSILGASSIIVEGYKIFDLTGTNGNLSGNTLNTLKNDVRANGELFVGTAGSPSATYEAMLARLIGGNRSLESVLSIRPGAEIIHRTGTITFGVTNSQNSNDDWNFGAFRFGPKSAPGILTLRAAGDIVFNNGFHDGFVLPTTGTIATRDVYRAPLMDANPLLPMNAQSWSYRITSGADFSAADYRNVQPLSALGGNLGSIKLGRNMPRSSSGGANFTTLQLITGANSPTGTPTTNRYQVIRTGSGDIDISAGRDVQLLNPFATIYTAGTKITDPTMGGKFDVPLAYISSNDQGTSLGAVQQDEFGYPVQYTLGGGNVRVRAQSDIVHLTRLTNTSELVADSQRQLPINWLYRRGFIDPATGKFGSTPRRFPTSGGTELVGGDVTSTSWWVDFSNFFQGIGTLGGGDVTLEAGRNVSNVDAVAATNARLPKDATSADQLVELGGGDVTVRAGNDIDGGVYYVERGRGTLVAGNEIKTNSTRTPSNLFFNPSLNASLIPGEQAWLPTTLFLGKGTFDVSARGNVLLGPTANVFMLPEGINNSIWYKTWFSTYASDSAVNVSSLGGSLTLRTHVTLPSGSGGTISALQAWVQTQLLLVSGASTNSASFYHPWLRLNETNVAAYRTATTMLPPSLRATAFTGDLNLVGNFNLAPAPRGTVELVAGGAVNGLQPTGRLTANGLSLTTWATSRINLSDAPPSAIPGVTTPYAYRAFVGPSGDNSGIARQTEPGYLAFFDQLFDETGALDAVLQRKQALHAQGLHADDPEPLRLYAMTGDISGLTLYSAKRARIVAGQDITDNAFYLQNLSEDDISVVAAGRNILPYNASSPWRSQSQAAGNLPPGLTTAPQPPLAGDIQLSGPGTLAVLAGAILDLGTGATNANGTGSGIVTVGNARNPYLPFDGAAIIAGAGLGPVTSLTDAGDFKTFIDEFLLGEKGGRYLTEIDPELTETEFLKLSADQQARIALEAFYLVLRDAGRSENAPFEGITDGYKLGFAAIEALFPAPKEGGSFRGNIDTRSRDIRTKNGGSINIFAPRGDLTLATSVIGNPLVPPGIITESGGSISIFTDGDVDIGIGRIFTLRGGDMVIWSSNGNIAAGAAARTVKSAPPTRVLIDPQSGAVQTDLAGLATGGGIGVLATVAGVPPGDVDLIAPNGVVDAGDAGIRVSGNLSIAATAVLNASNITVAGSTTGVPSAPVIAAPNIGGLTAASNVAGAATSAASEFAQQQTRPPEPQEETPSIIVVDVLGYGGEEDSNL